MNHFIQKTWWKRKARREKSIILKTYLKNSNEDLENVSEERATLQDTKENNEDQENNKQKIDNNQNVKNQQKDR